MKVVIQRVSEARVKVSDKIISEIKLGFLILLGVEKSDSLEDINWLVKKILNRFCVCFMLFSFLLQSSTSEVSEGLNFSIIKWCKREKYEKI